MTYLPPPRPDGTDPPPPDPPIEAYQPPGPDGTYSPPFDPPIQAYQPPVPPHPQAYGAAGRPYPGQAYPYAPAPPTQGLAVASLVVSCTAVLCLCFSSPTWLLGVVGGLLGGVGAILGHVARRRIRATGAGGAGLALGGIVVGWIVVGVAVLGVAAMLSFLAESGRTS